MSEEFTRCDDCPALNTSQEKGCRRKVSMGECVVNEIVKDSQEGLVVRSREILDAQSKEAGKMMPQGIMANTVYINNIRRDIEVVKVNPEYL